MESKPAGLPVVLPIEPKTEQFELTPVGMGFSPFPQTGRLAKLKKLLILPQFSPLTPGNNLRSLLTHNRLANGAPACYGF